MIVAFGTDGIRGVAGTWPITAEVATAVGRVAAARAPARRVIVGADPRPSSAELSRAIAVGVASAGGVALEAGVLPTSAVGLAVAADPGALGVMVTASHNPWTENGFKWLGAGGRKPDDALAERIGHEIGAALADRSQASGGWRDDAHAAVFAGWVAAMDAALPDRAAIAGRRIALDLANGAASSCWPWLVGLPVHWERVDGDGQVNEGVGSEHVEALCARVRGAACAAGLAVDADADRCVLVDEKGTRIPGDALLWRLALDRGVSGLAATVMSSSALELSLPGVDVVRTPVGDRFVRAAMDAGALPLGGEESGHLLFADFPAGDALLAGLRALCAAFSVAPTLAEGFSGFPRLPRCLLRVPVAGRRSLADWTQLTELTRAEEARLGAGGRIFLRYSGTEPVLRVLVEGVDGDAVTSIAHALAALVQADRP